MRVLFVSGCGVRRCRTVLCGLELGSHVVQLGLQGSDGRLLPVDVRAAATLEVRSA